MDKISDEAQARNNIISRNYILDIASQFWNNL